MTVPQKVTCIETGEVYQNADEAGKAIGRSPLSVRKSANAHIPVAGKHFVYGALSSEELMESLYDVETAEETRVSGRQHISD